MQTYVQTLIEETISAWTEWRDAQCRDEDKQFVDDFFMGWYLELDAIRDILG